MPKIQLPAALRGPVVQEYGPALALGFGESIIADMNDNYYHGKLMDPIDKFLHTYTCGLMGHPHDMPIDQQWRWMERIK
jgi:hypothetical protein